jgi:hypothetical protein
MPNGFAENRHFEFLRIAYQREVERPNHAKTGKCRPDIAVLAMIPRAAISLSAAQSVFEMQSPHSRVRWRINQS